MYLKSIFFGLYYYMCASHVLPCGQQINTYHKKKLPVHVNGSCVSWPAVLWHNLTVFEGAHSVDWVQMFRTAVHFILCFFLFLDVPNEIKAESCESKDQNPEAACQSQGVREQAEDQLERKESTAHANVRPAASKTQSRTGPKFRAKKWVQKIDGRRRKYRCLHKLNCHNHSLLLIMSLCRTENKSSQNRKVTDYYPIRRSNRKTKTELKVRVKKLIHFAFLCMRALL